MTKDTSTKETCEKLTFDQVDLRQGNLTLI